MWVVFEVLVILNAVTTSELSCVSPGVEEQGVCSCGPAGCKAHGFRCSEEREVGGARAVLHLPVQGRHSLSWGLVQSSLLTGQCDGALFKRNLCLSSVNL